MREQLAKHIPPPKVAKAKVKASPAEERAYEALVASTPTSSTPASSSTFEVCGADTDGTGSHAASHPNPAPSTIPDVSRFVR